MLHDCQREDTDDWVPTHRHTQPTLCLKKQDIKFLIISLAIAFQSHAHISVIVSHNPAQSSSDNIPS